MNNIELQKAANQVRKDRVPKLTGCHKMDRRTIEFTVYVMLVKYRKGRCGKLLCLRDTVNI